MTTVDTWDPNQQDDNAPSAPIDKNTLLKLAQLCTDETPVKLAAHLTPEEIQAHRHLMKRHKEDWLSVAATLEQDTLLRLIRFFTLAENQLPGWEAGSKSPVIWLCRELKKRGAFPDPALIGWIKDHTDNKFLPYGNILDL